MKLGQGASMSWVPVVAFASCWWLVAGAGAATIEVETKADEFGSGGKCGLREAVRAANDNSAFGGCPKGRGTDTVRLGKGVYRLTRTGAPDDDATNGDLDVNGPLTLTGKGSRKTVIDGNGDVTSERVIDALDTGAAGMQIARLAIVGGSADSGGALNGGAVDLTGAADVEVRGSLIGGNFAGSDGGGINVGNDPAARLTVVGSTVSGNVGDSNAGGINAEDGRIVIRDSVVADNDTPGSNGGGIGLEGGRLLISNSSVSDNEAGTNGGGIYLSGAQLEMEATIVKGNVAGNTGGGIRLGGGLGSEIQTIARSTIAANSSGSSGGGIEHNSADTTITESTVSRNDAGEDAGGISSFTGTGSLTVTNSTISGNEADDDGGGLAVDEPDAVVALRSTTVTRNAANDDESGGGDGGGLLRTFGTLTLANTIVADNFAFDGGVTPDCNGAITSDGHNLIGIDAPATCVAAPGTGDQIGTSVTPVLARLAPLASSGGPTKTHALLPGSPAINAGSPEALGSSTTACPPRDQRRERRDDCDGGLLRALDPRLDSVVSPGSSAG